MEAIEPIILAQEKGDAMARISMHVPGSLVFFKGHFPKYPVVPGFVQVDWVIRSAYRCFAPLGEVTALKALKFRDMLLPDTAFSLQLHFQEAQRAVHFEIMGEQSRYSRGIVLFS